MVGQKPGGGDTSHAKSVSDVYNQNSSEKQFHFKNQPQNNSRAQDF
jgi:hypothetical protein